MCTLTFVKVPKIEKKHTNPSSQKLLYMYLQSWRLNDRLSSGKLFQAGTRANNTDFLNFSLFGKVTLTNRFRVDLLAFLTGNISKDGLCWILLNIKLHILDSLLSRRGRILHIF